MACNCDIQFGYTVTDLKSNYIIPPFTITSAGTQDGKDYFTWTDSYGGENLKVLWNPIENRWELWIIAVPEVFLAYLDQTGECPGISNNSTDWVITDEGTNKGFVSFTSILSNCLEEETINSQEDVDCFPILVWNKQCEFSKCVLNYLQKLQFGILDCKDLETLKNKKRVLEILNCYDTRDILNDTTNYNNITYSDIKKLLNY